MSSAEVASICNKCGSTLGCNKWYINNSWFCDACFFKVYPNASAYVDIKASQINDELHLLLIARLNVVESILVNKLGIDSKELEALYLKEVKEVNARVLKVTNKELK